MLELEPVVAAELARDIYDVQSELFVKGFLQRREFSQTGGQTQKLTASVGFRIANVKDGFGICAVGGNGYSDDVFLIFRGSTTANQGADWVSNARIGVEYSRTGLPVHIGFNNIFTTMLPDIESFLDSNHVTGTVHCIGHSLGGAVATLCSDWVKSRYGNTVKLYTFGAPRPGLMLFSWMFTGRFHERNIYRVFHTTDPVPMIPIFPFMHPPISGEGYNLPSSEAILSAEAHDMDKYVDDVRNKDWAALNKRKPAYSVETLIEGWLDSVVPVNPADPKVWHWIDAAMKFVLKKIVGGVLIGLQTAFSGIVTVVDTLAWMLMKGIEFSEYLGKLVYKLMVKIMQALSITVLKTEAEITQAFIREMLLRLTQKLNHEAMRALRQMN